MGPPNASFILSICDKIYQNNHDMSDDDIKQLYKLCQTTFLNALELVDNGFVEKLCLENSSRFYFRIEDGKHFYSLYPHINFCECPSYKESMDKQLDFFICKHTLACLLSISLMKYKERKVSEYSFAD